MAISTRLMVRDDWNNVADLIYRSLNAWYRKYRGFDLVTGAADSMLVFPRVYESLDPDCCFLAIDDETGRLAGSCFIHPRPTHISLGILNVHPDFFGKGAASVLMRRIVDYADEKHLPLRLVSSSMNLESFCLYNRYGFVPTLFFQDMTVTVPADGFPVELPPHAFIRAATVDDIPEMVALEKELYSIDREKDFQFFIKNDERIWRTSLILDDISGRIEGFVVSVLDPGSHMIGPGISRTEKQMAALIRYELNAYPGKTPVWLIPTNALDLRKSMYELGAKNCELHIGQVRGEFTPARGIVLPSFMPETS